MRVSHDRHVTVTLQVFENVTILFSDVVGFTRICSQITPMAVVSMLNGMYTSFDQLSEKNKVYKVVSNLVLWSPRSSGHVTLRSPQHDPQFVQ